MSTWVELQENALPRLAASGGADLIGYQRPEVGSVARTVQDLLRRIVTLEDFGAVGDGVADDTAAFNSAVTAADRKLIWLEPDKTYLVDALTITGSATSPIGIAFNGATLKARTAAQTHVLKIINPHNVDTNPVRFYLDDFRIDGDSKAVIGLHIQGSQYCRYVGQARNCTSRGVFRDASAGFGIFYNHFDLVVENNGSRAAGDAGMSSIASDSTFRIASNYVRVICLLNKGNGIISDFDQDNYWPNIESNDFVGWEITNTRSIAVLGGYSEGNNQNIATNGQNNVAITAFADGGGGQVVVTSNAHGIQNNQEHTIAGTTNYNGLFTATNVTANTFEITATWVSDDATGTATPTDTAFELLTGSTGARGVKVLGGRFIGAVIGAAQFNPGNDFNASTFNSYQSSPHTFKDNVVIEGDFTHDNQIARTLVDLAGESINDATTFDVTALRSELGTNTTWKAVLGVNGGGRCQVAWFRAAGAAGTVTILDTTPDDVTADVTWATDGSKIQITNASGAVRVVTYNIVRVL